MQPFCTNCYKANARKHCGRCHRRYCSRECQAQDWQEKGHKQLCGKGGQLGKDFEIKPSSDKKGVGIFAIRDFKMGEKIILEYPINPNTNNPHATALLNELKLSRPAPKKFSIFPIICCANHECVGGNTSLRQAGGPMIVKASRLIGAGEEITCDYLEAMDWGRTNIMIFPRALRAAHLKATYGIDCQCKACTDPAIEAKIMQLGEVFGRMDRCLASPNPQPSQELIDFEKNSLSLFEELGHSIGLRAHACLSLVYALMRDDRVPEAREAAAKALDYCTIWYDDDPDHVWRKVAVRLASDLQGGVDDYVELVHSEHSLGLYI